MDKPLWGLRVQAPLGARVLSFVCCAPNDGFSPQSGLVQRGVLYAAAWGSENHTTALTGEEMQSPFGGWRHHLSARSSVGRQKESALMGRLGALLRPTWRSYAGPPQWHYKAPLCCELLMKGLLCGSLLSHHTVGGRWCRKAPKGGGKPPEVADRRNTLHDV